MRGAARRHAVPIGFAVVAAVISVPLAWMGATPLVDGCDFLDEAPMATESSEDRVSLWPPGFRCTYFGAGGVRLPGEDTYVTWYELTLAGLFVAAVYLVTALTVGVVSLRRFAVGAALAAVVFLAASAAFFV